MVIIAITTQLTYLQILPRNTSHSYGFTLVVVGCRSFPLLECGTSAKVIPIFSQIMIWCSNASR